MRSDLATRRATLSRTANRAAREFGWSQQSGRTHAQRVCDSHDERDGRVRLTRFDVLDRPRLELGQLRKALLGQVATLADSPHIRGDRGQRALNNLSIHRAQVAVLTSAQTRSDL
jgi:hypothetical protein